MVTNTGKSRKEYLQRLRDMEVCLAQNKTTFTILEKFTKEWGCSETTVRKYMRVVYRKWNRLHERDSKYLLQSHIQRREKLAEVAYEDEDYRLTLDVLKDIARLQGLYEDNYHITNRVHVDDADIFVKMLGLN